jgi:hypothetical protein
MRRWDFFLVAGMLGMLCTGLQGQAGTVVQAVWQVRLPADLPVGAMVLCRAKVMPGVGDALRSGIMPAGTADGERSGTVVRCAVEVPVWWNERQKSNGAWLSTEVDAVESTPDGQKLLRLAVEDAIPLQVADGGAAPVSLRP